MPVDRELQQPVQQHGTKPHAHMRNNLAGPNDFDSAQLLICACKDEDVNT